MDFIGHSMLVSNDLGSIWSYLIILFLAFLDTVFVIGTIFPGSIMVMGIGFLAAYSVLNIWACLFFVVIGGLFGDALTYFFGMHGTNWFKNESKLLKFTYLKKGQDFFDKHGDKSIVLGRFMGVIKAVVPFVAGLVRMDFKKFIYLNIISGLIFAIFYLGLGFFLGVSMDRFVVPKDLKMLVVALPFLIFFIWIFFESRTKLFKAVKKFFK